MKAKFSGHETFSLRYGWLKKATDFVASGNILQTSDEARTRDAVVELGIGKNMVNSIRYWAEASGVIKSDQTAKDGLTQTVSDEASSLFGINENNNWDQYLESPGGIWLIHFWLNFNDSVLTSYRYFFNYANAQVFEKNALINMCLQDGKRMTQDDGLNERTIKKDIDCFLNTYTRKRLKSAKAFNEDMFTSPLTELGLVSEESNGVYASLLGEREGLPIEVFLYSLLRFANLELEDSKASSIDFESLLSKPLSPGRIFRLSESGLSRKLDDVQEYTNGKLKWVDSLGLRQVQMDQTLLSEPTNLLKKYFKAH